MTMITSRNPSTLLYTGRVKHKGTTKSMKTYNIDITNTKKEIHKSSLNLGGKNPKGDKISFSNYYMELNGKPFFGISGEFHFSRYPHKYWEEEILKMKMAGINIISTYIFWIHHEETEGDFDWNGNKNLRLFIELCAKHGMYVFIRIGPFDHGECRNGGIPDWLYGRPFEVRSNDNRYLYFVKILYKEIFNQVKGQFFKDGGTIIGVQLENEYMHAGAPWEITAKHGDEFLPAGNDGASHMKILKDIAIENGFDVPIYVSTGWGGAPVLEDEILPLYGGYAFCPWNINENTPEQSPTREFIFKDYHNDNIKSVDFNPPYQKSKYPYACCEMGSGMQVWYLARFVVPPESTTALTIQQVAGGCNFVGYYVYHGGSNPIGKHSFLNENTTPKISYDFQAPIGEFGQIKKSYKYLKTLFLFFKEFEEYLSKMKTILPDSNSDIQPETTNTLRFAVRAKENSGFIFVNNYQDHVEMTDLENIKINLNLPEETILFPEKDEIKIKKNISAIFPYNFEMEGIRLKYSTTQLLSKIIDNDSPTYFFFTPDGIEGEYCFDSSNIKNIETTNCKIEKSDSKIFAYTKAGKNCIINITNNDGVQIKISTLTFNEASGFYKVKLWDKERVIISNSNILVSDEEFSIFDTGNTEFEFSIYPKIEKEIYFADKVIEVKNEGIYYSYKASVPIKKIDIDFKKISNQKATVRIPDNAFDGINDIFLHIDYEGDVGNAFIDGRLINDNFYNGTTWEIGLKRFYPDIINKEIYFYIIPKKKGKIITMDSAMALKQEFSGEQFADIRSIKAIPEYKISIRKNVGITV